METVSIRLPAWPEYVRVVRLVAAGLAARLGFTIDDIDDLKIGVDELCGYLVGSSGRNGVLEIRFEIHPERIEITGTGTFSAEQTVPSELTVFSRQILDTVADSATLQAADGDGAPTFHLTKSRAW